MSRIKLIEQASYKFQHTLSVRMTDLNYGNHLANQVLVGYLNEARVRLFDQLGCSELDLGDGQTGIILGDLAVNFKIEGLLFDQILIESQIDEISRKSFRLFYRLSKQGQILALAETGIIAFNYQTRKAVPLPSVFLARLEAA